MKTEKNIKQSILNSIAKIYDQGDCCNLSSEFFEKIEPELGVLSEYFQTTNNQSLLIAMVFAFNSKGETLNLNDLNSYFHSNPMKLLEYSDDFDFLHQTGILHKEQAKNRSRISLTSHKFTINEKITEAILQSKQIPDLKPKNIDTIYDLLEKLGKLYDSRDEEKISTAQLFRDFDEVINNGRHFPLIANMNKYDLNVYDTLLFLYLIWQVMNGSQSIMIGTVLEVIFDDVNERMQYMQEINLGKNELITNKWVELEKSNFFNYTCIELAEGGKTLLSESEINLFSNEKKSSNILYPEDILERELIFSEVEMHQLFLLKDLLKPEKLEEMQKRLTSKNLPKGLTTLLHGAPGTGKTEIVKQIARETGRAVMKVEISQSKSMWFGESEKVIKRVFTDYQAFAKKCKLTPILFFNEADAILSKRQGIGSSNVAQTENAIQNILLEEFENFEGILFATTNLIANLDSAFDRRFLFKIRFQKPNVSVKVRIWKLKLPVISNSECELLATQFDFSGGQIDNIVRKVDIRELIYGEEVAFNQILDFCREETFGESRVRIGFSNG
ncbi:AAA family ATPase [Cryomorpha ignava]|uniref:AAA family ATPase n=1 Tax=Cryomorpha ignava TaxID=101383 RepID=A0A7K3WS03_9FLAO|nr:ATP-binding protein [Cryomorpha ignava]NEN24306.1 AAA family ATPase [Cryomorpha ignava]